MHFVQSNTVKLVYNGHSQNDQKLFFKNNYRLMHVRSIAECSKESILQYFWPLLLKLSFVIKIFVLSIFKWPLKKCSLWSCTKCTSYWSLLDTLDVHAVVYILYCSWSFCSRMLQWHSFKNYVNLNANWWIVRYTCRTLKTQHLDSSFNFMSKKRKQNDHFGSILKSVHL